MNQDATNASGATQPAGATPPPPAPSPTPGERLKKVATDLAMAEAMKPLEGPINEVYSVEAKAGRDKLKKAYDAAIAANGPLSIKYQAAKKSFERAAVDMEKDGRLDKWLASALGPTGAIKQKLDSRKTAKSSLDSLAARMGTLEEGRAVAAANAKRFAERFADWSAPVDKLLAQIGLYADKIDKLNADINNDVASAVALTTFWFEVAPKHLQIAGDLGSEAQTAVDKVVAALSAYPDIAGLLKLGKLRGDRTLYLAKSGARVEDIREATLTDWQDAAGKLAEAEAAFKLAPDDAVTIKQRYDKLKDDLWIAQAKLALEAS